MQVKGRLLLSNGDPAVGYRFWAQDDLHGRLTFPQVETGPEGDFALTAQPNTWSPQPLAEGDEVAMTFYVVRGGWVYTEIFEESVTWQEAADLELKLQLSAPTDGTYFHVFCHVSDGNVPGAGMTVRVTDKSGARQEQSTTIGPNGWGNVWLPFLDGSVPQVEFAVLDAEGNSVPFYPMQVNFDADHSGWAYLNLSYELAGTVIDRGTGKGVEQVRVEVWDTAGTSNLATGYTDAAGAFAASLWRGTPPPETPTVRIYWLAQLLDTVTPTLKWSAAGRAEGLALEIGHEAEPLPIYTVKGTAIDRATRRGAAALRVEAWAPDGSYMLGVADTDDNGAFTITLAPAADKTAPQASFRLYKDGQVVAQPDVPLVWNVNAAEIFMEADLPAAVPRAARITGRLIEKTTHDALGGLRLEAWDTSPRDGGLLGVSAVTAPDGTFDIAFPLVEGNAPRKPDGPAPPIRQPAPAERGMPAGFTLGNGGPPHLQPAFLSPTGPAGILRPPMTPPIVEIPRTGKLDLVFRIYDGDRLAAVVLPEISWAPEGIATAVVEIPAPTPPGSTQEVGLHEIGESVASTVDRVQTELARYPNSMGAYLLDEIDLRLPVEMRVDELGQVRTKVVDAANATGPEVGELHLRIRPVLGATQRTADVSDQPLSVLSELSPATIAQLEGQRIYSVENLARVATTGAGRAALEALDLGLDLNALLEKAALLAFAGLPRAVREALVALHIASLREFATYTERAALTTGLSTTLGQEISEDDVVAWQKRVAAALTVPRPSVEVKS